uniref:Uncharacterized protein n=1 Tax=Sinocyclocheilus rhinocerous TaxID=307959 RepID=A0A673GB46_9TELE
MIIYGNIVSLLQSVASKIIKDNTKLAAILLALSLVVNLFYHLICRFLSPAAEEACQFVKGIVGKNPLLLKELNLSERELGDTRVNQISALLLSDCSITEDGYKALASALRSNPSHLIELDLTGNDPGPSGVKELLDVLQDPNCKLILSPAAQEACEYLTQVLGKSPLVLKELDLSEDKLGNLDGEKLSALLMDSHSKLETMKLNDCELTEKSCSVLATVLSTKTILKEMNLNNSRLLDSGVKEICEGLKNPVCELKILKLSNCALTEESYSALASVLGSDSSSLKELDLSNNNLQDSGVKPLSDGLKENCKLEKLSLHELGDTRVNQISALLQDKHCKLNTLM